MRAPLVVAVCALLSACASAPVEAVHRPAPSRVAVPTATPVVDPVTGEIDYGQAVPLDAEALAEQGVIEAYGTLAPVLRQHDVPVVEASEPYSDGDTYTVLAGGRTYAIHTLATSESDAWGNATFALFDIVNEQLGDRQLRFFALNGGNDLEGIFMTVGQAQRSRQALPHKSDWPYLPTAHAPWFGAPHD